MSAVTLRQLQCENVPFADIIVDSDPLGGWFNLASKHYLSIGGESNDEVWWLGRMYGFGGARYLVTMNSLQHSSSF